MQTTSAPRSIYYRYAQIDGVRVFYREAGTPGKPVLLLLHGFPTSSFMFRDLLPKLATAFHLIAPDYPGFGESEQPSRSIFAYTFDHYAEVVTVLLEKLGITRFILYMQDYGAPVGMRLFAARPHAVIALISQNGNAYAEGLSPFWDEYLKPLWKDRNSNTEAKAAELLTLASTKLQYLHGARDVERVSPDGYARDQALLDRPGNREIQLDLFYDYRTNVASYEGWHHLLANVQPRVLAIWGKNDPIFLPAGAEAFRNDVPAAEVHLLDTGHFALEEDSEAIASAILDFVADGSL